MVEIKITGPSADQTEIVTTDNAGVTTNEKPVLEAVSRQINVVGPDGQPVNAPQVEKGVLVDVAGRKDVNIADEDQFKIQADGRIAKGDNFVVIPDPANPTGRTAYRFDSSGSGLGVRYRISEVPLAALTEGTADYYTQRANASNPDPVIRGVRELPGGLTDPQRATMYSLIHKDFHSDDARNGELTRLATAQREYSTQQKHMREHGGKPPDGQEELPNPYEVVQGRDAAGKLLQARLGSDYTDDLGKQLDGKPGDTALAYVNSFGNLRGKELATELRKRAEETTIGRELEARQRAVREAALPEEERLARTIDKLPEGIRGQVSDQFNAERIAPAQLAAAKVARDAGRAEVSRLMRQATVPTMQEALVAARGRLAELEDGVKRAGAAVAAAPDTARKAREALRGYRPGTAAGDVELAKSLGITPTDAMRRAVTEAETGAGETGYGRFKKGMDNVEHAVGTPGRVVDIGSKAIKGVEGIAQIFGYVTPSERRQKEYELAERQAAALKEAGQAARARSGERKKGVQAWATAQAQAAEARRTAQRGQKGTPGNVLADGASAGTAPKEGESMFAKKGGKETDAYGKPIDRRTQDAQALAGRLAAQRRLTRSDIA